MITKETILQMTKALLPYQVKIRRHLHQYPELSYEEFKTTAFLKKELARNKVGVKKLKMKTGALALINPRKKIAAAIRSDIDALPITECARVPFKSKVPGTMHACGHDMHMATVLGTAIILNKLKDVIPGCVKFFFQPAEESPPGGAVQMIGEGVMQSPPVKMVFGLHVDPTLNIGKVSFRDGPVMASVIDLDITINGVGGHAALPHRTVDAISVGCEVVESLQKVISRETNPMSPTLLSFGKFSGGTVRNVICDKVKIFGTIRSLDSEMTRLMPKLVKRTVDGICKARGASAKIDILSGYPVLTNHPKANVIYSECFSELFGSKNIEPTAQTLGGEDFAYYVQKTPGAMFRLGVKNDKIGANKSWHSPEFMVDEEAIYYGTSLLTMSVLRYFGVI